jgi:hypothetical protein
LLLVIAGIATVSLFLYKWFRILVDDRSNWIKTLLIISIGIILLSVAGKYIISVGKEASIKAASKGEPVNLSESINFRLVSLYNLTFEVLLALSTSAAVALLIDLLSQYRAVSNNTERNDFKKFLPFDDEEGLVSIILPRFIKHKQESTPQQSGNFDVKISPKSTKEDRPTANYYSYGDMKAATSFVSLFSKYSNQLPGITADSTAVLYIYLKKDKNFKDIFVASKIKKYLLGRFSNLERYAAIDDLANSIEKLDKAKTIVSIGVITNSFLINCLHKNQSNDEEPQFKYLPENYAAEKTEKRLFLLKKNPYDILIARREYIDTGNNTYKLYFKSRNTKEEDIHNTFFISRLTLILGKNEEKTVLVCGGFKEKGTRHVGNYIAENWKTIMNKRNAHGDLVYDREQSHAIVNSFATLLYMDNEFKKN